MATTASTEFRCGGYMARVTYQVEGDVAQNRSVVRITRVELKALYTLQPTTMAFLGSIRVNGVEAVTMTMGDTYACSAAVSSQAFGGGGVDGPHGGWAIGFKTKDMTAEHGADGNARITISLAISLYFYEAVRDSVVGSGTADLPQIPRTSDLEVTGAALGQELVMVLTRASADFEDTITWRCGTASGTLAERTKAQELRWTPPLELSFQAPADTRVKVVLTVTTFLGETQAGSRDTEILCPIPGSVTPSLTVAVEDRMGYAAVYGGFIQGQSQAKVTTQAAGAYGSTIRSVSVKCGKLTGSGEQVAFALEDSGSVGITVTVTDSRGRTASQNTAVTVLAYKKPWALIREAVRCDEGGNVQPDGAWLKLVFDAGVTTLTGNTAQYKAVRTVHGGGSAQQVTLTDYAGHFTVTGGQVILPAGVDTGYDCQIQVQDSFRTGGSDTVLVSVAFALLDLCRATRAVGIGMRAKKPGAVSIGLNMDMSEHRLSNLASPESETDAATKAYVDECIRQLREQLNLNEE